MRFWDAYKSGADWTGYEDAFNRLLQERKPNRQARELLAKEAICLLCAEPTPDKCHRRLVAEYLRELAPNIEIKHL